MSPANQVAFFSVRANKFAKWKTGLILLIGKHNLLQSSLTLTKNEVFNQSSLFQAQASGAMDKMADFMLANAQHTSGSALTSAATGLVSGLGYMVSASSNTVSKSGSNETGANSSATIMQVGVSDDERMVMKVVVIMVMVMMMVMMVVMVMVMMVKMVLVIVVMMVMMMVTMVKMVLEMVVMMMVMIMVMVTVVMIVVNVMAMVITMVQSILFAIMVLTNTYFPSFPG